MTGLRILRFAVPALALLAAACSTHPSNNTTTSKNPPAVTNTAPNVENPYATDPMDPDMNPRNMRGFH